MIDSNTYKNILDSTVIPQGVSAEDQNSRLLPLDQYVQRNLPAKLYRYRKCSERQMDEFYNDKISFAPGTEMNDDFEAMTMFNKKELRSQFEKSVQQAKSKEFDQGIEEAATVIANVANISNTEILSQAQSSPIVNKKHFDRILSKSSADFDFNIEEISKTIQSQGKRQ